MKRFLVIALSMLCLACDAVADKAEKAANKRIDEEAQYFHDQIAFQWQVIDLMREAGCSSGVWRFTDQGEDCIIIRGTGADIETMEEPEGE